MFPEDQKEKAPWTRRRLFRLAAALPAAITPLGALAAAARDQIKITGIRAMGIRNIAGNCLIRVDTDAGISGYGEAGCSGAMARSRTEEISPLLAGKNPLMIEVHFHELTTQMHPHMAQIPVVSGIDIALWDLAGKILGQPVYRLLGGPFRDAIPLYSHGAGFDALDPTACRDWAQRVRQAPEGFRAYKIGVDRIAGVRRTRFANTLDRDQVRRVARGYGNIKDAAGEAFDIAVHCHNEFDTPSAIAVARAVEPLDPLFYEDPLHVPFSEGWMALRRATRLTLLTGEKLEMVAGFRPFLDRQAVDIVHPDLAFTGGISGARRIAQYAALTRTPVALHNVGSAVLCAASAHFGAAIRNFYRSETALGHEHRTVESMTHGKPLAVLKGMLPPPSGPGLGIDLDEEYLRRNLAPGEPYWRP